MTTTIHKTAQLGELVVTAYDKAALYSAHTHLCHAATLHGATIIT